MKHIKQHRPPAQHKTPERKLSDALMGVAQLLIHGQFRGEQCKLVVEAVNLMEVLSENEKRRELGLVVAEEPTTEETKSEPEPEEPESPEANPS